MVKELKDAKEQKDEDKKKLYPRSLKEIKKARKKNRVRAIPQGDTGGEVD